MLKGLFSFVAFLLLTISISSFTTHVFLNSAFDNFDETLSSSLQKNDVFVDEASAEFYSNLNEGQKQSIEQLKSLSPGQRQILTGQCTEDKKDEIFCNPDFISGEKTFDEVMRSSINTQVDDATTIALQAVRQQLESYNKYPFLLIGFVTGILSLLIYLFLFRLAGIQYFSGHMIWLSFLSAVLFKAMPLLINKIVEITQAGQEGLSLKMAAFMKDLIIGWLVPAMDKTFMLCIVLMIAGIAVFFIVKIMRKYSVEVS